MDQDWYNGKHNYCSSRPHISLFSCIWKLDNPNKLQQPKKMPFVLSVLVNRLGTWERYKNVTPSFLLNLMLKRRRRVVLSALDEPWDRTPIYPSQILSGSRSLMPSSFPLYSNWILASEKSKQMTVTSKKARKSGSRVGDLRASLMSFWYLKGPFRYYCYYTVVFLASKRLKVSIFLKITFETLLFLVTWQISYYPIF